MFQKILIFLSIDLNMSGCMHYLNRILESIWPLNLLFNLVNQNIFASTGGKFWLLTYSVLGCLFTIWFLMWKFWNTIYEFLDIQSMLNSPFTSITMRTNLPKLLDLLIFYIYSLNFSLEFFIMIFFVTNQLIISKFLSPQICKTLISY